MKNYNGAYVLEYYDTRTLVIGVWCLVGPSYELWLLTFLPVYVCTCCDMFCFYL